MRHQTFIFAFAALLSATTLVCLRPGRGALLNKAATRLYNGATNINSRMGSSRSLNGKFTSSLINIHNLNPLSQCRRGGGTKVRTSVTDNEDAATKPTKPKAMISSKLDWLSHYTEIIPDAFTIEGVNYKPKSGTVSGPLILRLLEQRGQSFIDEEVKRALATAMDTATTRMVVSVQPKEMLAHERRSVYALVAAKMAQMVSGRVSIEVDPRVSHEASLIVQEVQELAKCLSNNDVEVKSKILFKIPGTWEGILAAKMLTLQEEEYSCQVTHVYSMAQATAAAEAKVAVIQPYVGRVNDWYSQHPDKVPRELQMEGVTPGVVLAGKIFNFIKKYQSNSKVMAVSVRNIEDAIALSGVDYMVLAPPLIRQLANMPGQFEPPALSPETAGNQNFTPQDVRGHDLGECAEELLEASIRSSSEFVDRVENILSNTAVGSI